MIVNRYSQLGKDDQGLLVPSRFFTENGQLSVNPKLSYDRFGIVIDNHTPAPEGWSRVCNPEDITLSETHENRGDLIWRYHTKEGIILGVYDFYITQLPTARIEQVFDLYTRSIEYDFVRNLQSPYQVNSFRSSPHH